MQTKIISNISEFKYKALSFANTFDICCFLDSNGLDDRYSKFDCLIAFGHQDKLILKPNEDSFSALKNFRKKNNGFILGGLSYELKNEIENLDSKNQDGLNFPNLFFFSPLHLLIIKGKKLQIISPDANDIFKLIDETIVKKDITDLKVNIKARLNPTDYRNKFLKIKNEISLGNIYETNFCMEFYDENCEISPIDIFIKLNIKSPTPFANFFKWNDKYIISATPERFLAKRNQKIISQPIKGTAKRSENSVEDIKIMKSLYLNPKERQENVMIVDLVRNDLTKFAIKGTVKVEELFGIYSFKHIHQMVSTVVCEIHNDTDNIDVIKNCFPMGSMTGAPKIKAMQLMDLYENSKRGMYAGAIGYFDNENDFDFNVIIRSILYNSSNKYLSFHVGSAITHDADPEKEYDECLLKIKAILEILQNKKGDLI
ncbi:aminobenzoate synthetase [Pedobacter psychrophilus]|uniref:Aminobenzoate synthetase n=1 Tax=Pedobacter psychrophilus TaxID=1826909 RepID=A0A179DFY0_9SPHI|nr:anthranilate synthase component I family protein [Pedobacter psychrophilus]OAQ39610.1 aminobenzoate synthetase [Pedobacter psychrophilus]